jgi:hypothetical protein
MRRNEIFYADHLADDDEAHSYQPPAPGMNGPLVFFFN